MNTIENVCYTARMLESRGNLKEVIIVTSDYHMERSRRTFEAIFAPVAPAAAITPLPVPIALSSRDRERAMEVERFMFDEKRLRADLTYFCTRHGIPFVLK